MRYTKKVSNSGGKVGYYRNNQPISKHEYDYMKSHKAKDFPQMLRMPAEMKQNVLLQIDDIRTILNMCKSDRDFAELCRTNKVQKHINNLKIKDLKEKNPDKSLEDIFLDAAYDGYTEVVKLLLNWVGLDGERVDPTADDNWAIRYATQRGHTEIVEMLLNWVGPNGERVDPTTRDNMAIRFTADNGHTEVVKLLLNWVGPNGERVDPTVNNNYAIRYAARFGHTEVVKLLLNWVGPNGERVDPTADNNFAIQYAAEYDHTEVIKLLMEDERVRNSLSPEELRKYQEMVN